MRSVARNIVRAWARTGRAGGYLYQFMDAYGGFLADDAPEVTRLPNGSMVYCDLRDHVERNLWLFGVYEPIEAFLFTRLLEPGMTVVDGGANIGEYTLLAARAVGEKGTVHSFEPIPATFGRLEEHVLVNGLGNVVLNAFALWHKKDMLRFQLPYGGDGNAGSYTARPAAQSDGGFTAAGISLDEYCQDRKLDRMDVIKLDVEGSEPFALMGARQTIRKHQPHIVMEVNRSALEGVGSSLKELWNVVDELGYKAWQIGPDQASSNYLSNFDCIEQSNVLLHARAVSLPLKSNWDERSCKIWARSRW